MTKILGRNPARRCKSVREWPAADRALRALALRAGDVIDEGGALACYSHAYIQKLDKGYGRWLQWLDMRGELDPAGEPRHTAESGSVHERSSQGQQHDDDDGAA